MPSDVGGAVGGDRARPAHGGIEGRLQVSGRQVAQRGVGGGRLLNGLDEGGGKVRTHVAQARPRPLAVGLTDVRERSTGDRIAARDQVIKERSQCIDVGTLVGHATCKQLGSHVERGAHDVGTRSRRGISLVLVTGAEIHQDDAAAFLAHDVAGGYIAVQQSGTVHGRQGLAQIDADRRRLPRAERPLLLDDLMQGAAADELHPDADPAIPRLGSVHGNHVGMAHAREQPAFVDHARRIAQRCRGIIRRGSAAQKLQRDFAVQLRVPRAIDLAKGAASDRFEQPEMPPRRDRAGFIERRRHRRRRRSRGVEVPMQGRDLGNDLELAHDRAIAGITG